MTTIKKADESKSKVWIVALGLLLILLGFGALAFPFLTTLSVEILVGSVFLTAGVVTVFHAFGAREWRGFFWELLIGVLYAVAGILFLANPFGGAFALTVMLGSLFLIEGILRIVLGFQVRPAANWGWVIASGGVSILLGLLIFAGMANGASLAVIGMLVGVNLVFAGSAFIAMGAGYGTVPVIGAPKSA